jgi:DNA-binding transcriptional LysR family regulator
MSRTVTLSFELLQSFVTLIRCGGDAAQAMRELGINQPTMSKRLRHVQHTGPLLDQPWVVRKGKTWALTDEGHRVWPAVVEIVDRYENLERFLSGEPTSVARPIRFGCGHQMVLGLVRDALGVFRKEHPQSPLRVSTLRGQMRIEQVSNGTLDLAIVSNDEPSILEIARRPLHVEPLASHRLALVCAQDSPWNRALRALPKDGVPAEGLASFPLILPEPDAGTRKALNEILRRQGLLGRLQIALEIGGWGAILAYVREGFGVGIVSEAVVPDEKGLTVRPLDPVSFLPIEAKLICRRLGGSTEELDLSDHAAAWRDVLRRVARRS